MSRLRPAFIVASFIAGIAGATPPARADVTQEQAQALEQQLRGWMTGLVGTAIPLSPRPIHVTPAGDHFLFSIEYAQTFGSDGASLAGDPVTATARPIDGGRWEITGVHLPSPLRFTDPKAVDPVPKSWGMKAADQSLHGTFDPSFATASTFDSEMRDVSQLTERDAGLSTTHLGHYAGHTVWQPTGDGLVDMQSNGRAEQLETTIPTSDGNTLTLKMARLITSGHAERVSMDNLGTAIRAAGRLIPALAAASEAAKKHVGPPVPAALTPADRETARTLASSTRAAIGSIETHYSVEDIRFDTGDGHTGTLTGMAFGFGVGAPAGKLDMHMLMTLDGFDSPEIPPGIIHDYFPKHISISPRITGVATEDVMALINRAIDSNGSKAETDQLDAMAVGLMAKGPLAISLDDVSLDAGPARLKATAALQVASASPDDITGEASITITGLDDLIRQSNTVPELRQAAPVLIFLKGIGKQTGDAVVWNISYAEQKVLVNGTDLSAMIPGK